MLENKIKELKADPRTMIDPINMFSNERAKRRSIIIHADDSSKESATAPEETTSLNGQLMSPHSGDERIQS